jgi:hypothetical protein
MPLHVFANYKRDTISNTHDAYNQGYRERELRNREATITARSILLIGQPSPGL